MRDLKDCLSFGTVVVTEFADDFSFSDKRGRPNQQSQSACRYEIT